MPLAIVAAVLVPFAVLAVALYALWAWGEKHDPMERSKLQFLTPGQSREDDPRD